MGFYLHVTNTEDRDGSPLLLVHIWIAGSGLLAMSHNRGRFLLVQVSQIHGCHMWPDIFSLQSLVCKVLVVFLVLKGFDCWLGMLKKGYKLNNSTKNGCGKANVGGLSQSGPTTDAKSTAAMLFCLATAHWTLESQGLGFTRIAAELRMLSQFVSRDSGSRPSA